jgi:hypothetical protein
MGKKENLRKLVEDEISYGRHHEVIGDFDQLERQLYESQDFEWTETGFVVKKKNPEDPDYSWDVLTFIQNNPELHERVQAMLDSGERLLRPIYTNKDNFETWAKFFERLQEEGFCTGDHVDINEKLNEGEEEDAMAYIETGLSIETVGERAIYHIDGETEEDEDWMSDILDPYRSLNQLPRDRYKTVGFAGFNEDEPEGKLHAARREETLRTILKNLNGTHHRATVARVRNEMSANWTADKEIYRQLKTREMTLDDASEAMYLTAKQWKKAFAAADQSWMRAEIYDEWYYSPEQKTKRRIRSNQMRDQLKVAVLNATTSDAIVSTMANANGNHKLGLLWKNDYKDVYGLAVMQWKFLKRREDEADRNKKD